MHRRLLALARGTRLPLLVTVLSGLLAGWLTIGQARALSLVVDGVFLGGQGWPEVRPMLVFLLGIIAGRAFLAWLTEVSASAVAIQVKEDLRERLFAKIERLGPAFTRAERSGELTAAALEGVEALDAYFSQYLPQLVITALVPLSVLLFVFPLDPLSGVVLLVTAPLIPVFMILIGKGAEIVTKRQYETLSLLSAHFLDSLQGLTTLKMFGRSKDHARSIAETSDRFRDVTLGVLRVTFLSALALELIATISTAVVAVEVGLRLLYGHLPFDKALFLLILAPEFYIPLRMLGTRFHAGMAGTTAAQRIFEVLDLQEPEKAKQEQQKKTQKAGRISMITIENLSFTYPGDAEPVLQNINLHIRAGEHLALVGPSGAGKSTLISLLLGFLQPQTGAIFTQYVPDDLSGTPWTIPGSPSLAEIAWVPQTPYLFHDTIAANLRLARSNASLEELEAAARAAHLDEFIHALSQGYETIIGEEGARLSGGEAQRLALARAFLKDAPILILDEPTSSLDPQTETLLQESTRRLMQGRTVITIAHRLNTVTRADRIVVLQAGRIVETGTHRQLLKRGGLYAQLVGEHAASIPPSTAAGQQPSAIRPHSTVGASAEPASSRSSQPQLPPLLIYRLLSFLRGSWGRVALSVLLGTATIAASVGLMGTSSWLISTAALHPSIAELNVAIVGVRFFGILRGVARYLERLTSHGVTFRLLARLRVWFYEKLEPLAPARLMTYRVGDLLNRIVADVEALENFYVRVVAPPLVALVIVSGTALFLGNYEARLGWTYLGFALLLGLGLPLLNRLLSRKIGRALTDLKSALRTQTVDYLQGLADLIAFGQGSNFRARLQATGQDYGDAQRQMAQVTGLSSAAGVFFTQLGMWSVLALSIPLVNSANLAGVMLATLALMAQASFEAVQPLPQAAQMLALSLHSARRLFEIVENPPPSPVNLPVPSAIHTPPLPSESQKTMLAVQSLTFAYPGADRPALCEVSFDLSAGKKIAVVGPSGAGKSTLVNLLLRFWEPPKGSIFLDGRDLLEVPQETACAHFGVISQRTYLFNVSLRENLLLANPSAGREAMERATRQAGIHEFIASLPQGYETMAGERGVRLSGGERQRVAIARALLRQASILLLDEPTANLDPLTERLIMENILTLAEGRSLLLITHRLVKMEAMDEILVLQDGQVTERGTHAALLAQDGLYRQMYALQQQVLKDASQS
ncbi:MAG: thiol reductant ABC exporter subunit CydD [Candidatus Villigracilaceae bacterium]